MRALIEKILDKKTKSEEELEKEYPDQDIDKQLEMGIEVELEHTSDRKTAAEIARDHIAEDPKYYTKLKKMENK